jgi:hypothetical protein
MVRPLRLDLDAPNRPPSEGKPLKDRLHPERPVAAVAIPAVQNRRRVTAGMENSATEEFLNYTPKLET